MEPGIPELGRFAEPAILILGRPMGPGTLYAALARLEERGLIEGLAPVDGRRPYRLTAVGAGVVADQLRDLAESVRPRLKRLGRSPG